MLVALYRKTVRGCLPQLAGEYGLRNKREIYRVALVLSKIRRAARELLKLDTKDPKRKPRVQPRPAFFGPGTSR